MLVVRFQTKDRGKTDREQYSKSNSAIARSLNIDETGRELSTRHDSWVQTIHSVTRSLCYAQIMNYLKGR